VPGHTLSWRKPLDPFGTRRSRQQRDDPADFRPFPFRAQLVDPRADLAPIRWIHEDAPAPWLLETIVLRGVVPPCFHVGLRPAVAAGVQIGNRAEDASDVIEDRLWRVMLGGL